MATYINLGQLTMDYDFCNQQVFSISINEPPLNRIIKPFLTICKDCKARLMTNTATIVQSPPQPPVIGIGGY